MPAQHWPARYDRAPLDHHWMEHGACLQWMDLPWIADRPIASERRQMAAVCASCPVLTQCRLFAVGARVTAGFWAGASRGEPVPTSAAGRPVEPIAARLDDVGGAA